ncbi:MAG: helix-turn-helix transcriptional regulator [Spirosomataceae bacterium]
MNKTEILSSVTQFNTQRGQETLHPSVTVLDQSKSIPVKANRCLSELYIIFLKDLRCEDFQYGRNQYDYQEDSMLFIAPGQVFGFDSPPERYLQPNGQVLAFHPDFIKGTALGRKMHEYGFFSYAAAEALHLSGREKQIVQGCFRNILKELEQGLDKHSKMLLLSNIELLLNYCIRFYDRQFITRETVNKDILVRFEQLLNEYFRSDLPQSSGVPTVAYFAEQLHLSANYFGDLIKRETGKTALDYLQTKIIDLAKEKVFDQRKTVSEVAYELGFKYPQHFTRLFKQKVGVSPLEYRTSLN